MKILPQFSQTSVAQNHFKQSLSVSRALKLSSITKSFYCAAQSYFESVAEIFDLTYKDRAEMMLGLRERVSWFDNVLAPLTISARVYRFTVFKSDWPARTTATELSPIELKKLFKIKKKRILISLEMPLQGN